MDSDNFYAAPTTTGGLLAYYREFGQRSAQTDIELVHFRDSEAALAWLDTWQSHIRPQAEAAIAEGHMPVCGFSFYTWNAAEFLQIVGQIKRDCPQILIIAGGPHVQQAEDYLGEDPIDLIVLGEGEACFQEILDADNGDFSHIQGLAWLGEDGIRKTAERPRRKDLDTLPSALDYVPLADDKGQALYDSISYETSRGCPFKCSFCEWGTGAIGGKMYQFSMERIERDWRHIIASGIKDIWLADSNFGALKNDLDKAKLICELKRDTGLPTSFATSWSKKHSPQVQEIVLLLNQHDLLPHYQLALQTLTPLALELSNRKNMSSNKYEPIAKQMAEEGVPIAAELIWGLPGDNLADFERNLDQLLATFPNLNIFGYTLLPGTEFYERREEYRIETIPVAGYGKAKGEYVVGCHTFDRDEGIEGYFLITAHIILVHGHLLPLTTRYLALSGAASVSPFLRRALRRLLANNADTFASQGIDIHDRMAVYEHRAAIFLHLIAQWQQSFEILHEELTETLRAQGTKDRAIERALQVLRLDQHLAPRCGERRSYLQDFDFPASELIKRLGAMELPQWDGQDSAEQSLEISTPGGVGEILKDPDGGGWLKADWQLAQHSDEQSLAVELISDMSPEQLSA